jgi:intracellular sulfur oxidation DsrE/DsrF family protein
MKPSSSRRNFLGTVALGATGALAAISNPVIGHAGDLLSGGGNGNTAEAEEWFKKVKGKHRIIYDAPEPHEGMPFIWTWAFYKTNNQTGSPDNDLTAVVVLRHNAIPFALEDKLWDKYKFGERFKINDNTTKAAALRNPFYSPKEGDFMLPGIDGIETLMKRGAMFCVCDLALTVYSMFTAQAMNLKPEDVKKEWVAGLLPGFQAVPSGVWAVGRAQEKGCAYCYAGG